MYKRFSAAISNALIKNLRSANTKEGIILSVMEYKIIFALFSKIKKTDTELNKYNIPIVDFCKFWNISYGGKQSEIISESVKSLSEKYYIVSDKHVKYLSSESYISDGTMHLKLDDSIYDYVINLDGNFTIFNLDIIAKLKSKFTIRLYMYLKMFENQQFYNIELPDAFAVLGDNIYTTKSQFNNNILKKAVNEINAKSDINISYRIEKYFAAPEKIRFFIDGKKTQKQSNNLDNRNKYFLDVYVDPDPYVSCYDSDENYFIDENEFPF